MAVSKSAFEPAKEFKGRQFQDLPIKAVCTLEVKTNTADNIHIAMWHRP
jgi:hypothetical protein